MRKGWIRTFLLVSSLCLATTPAGEAIAQTPVSGAGSPSVQPAIPAQATEDKALVLDGITFADDDETLFVCVRELTDKLGKTLTADSESGDVKVESYTIQDLRTLYDGTSLMPVSEAKGFGATVTYDPATHQATITDKAKSISVKTPSKSVIVDKAEQALMAYQGSHLVLRTHVSTGRPGHNTPSGNFVAGPVKERMHRSRLYNFAPMPYSVQVAGNVFIHGYGSVPFGPASHGCIRMPLTGQNPAKYFYNWVDVGTPVTVKGVWSYRDAMRKRMALRHHRVSKRSRLVAISVSASARGKVVSRSRSRHSRFASRLRRQSRAFRVAHRHRHGHRVVRRGLSKPIVAGTPSSTPIGASPVSISSPPVP